MSEDKHEPQMDFILNTLSDVTTKLSALTDAQARTDATVGVLAGQVQSLIGQVQNIARQQEHMNEVVAVIAESQQHTDERLNTLIDIVQNGRNGSS
ncbi:MAG TPA: hypothetical protein VGN95_07375 [Pyrinomonadaceae bacterium]|jgi:hypothetical protein|nr:hypothetical protein [Pyrinomonadaceae bacterium]